MKRCLWPADSDSTDVPAGLHAVNFTRRHTRWCAGWAGWQTGKAINWSCRRRSPRVSPYNALGNAAAAASQLLQHSSELQR